jgi:hypothetical protein
MLASIILFTLMFAILAITTGCIAAKADSEGVSILATILCLVLSVATIVLPLAGGCGGEFGYNTYKEVPTTNFSKALLSDHSAVVIRYPAENGQSYTFTQFNVVHNYSSITNIIICERKSVFGNQTEFNIKIVTPPYQEQ